MRTAHPYTSSAGRTRAARLAPLVMLAALVAACAESPSPIGPPGRGLSAKGAGWDAVGRIVFYSERAQPDNRDIYSMKADGSDVVRLTDQPGNDMHPVVTPDGRRIAFFSMRDGTYGIYVMNGDGSGVTQVVDGSDFILFQSREHAISPDGQRIAFVAGGGASLEIFVVNVDGTGLTQLTNNEHDDRYPSFGPRGRQIVFASDREGGDTEIYTMNADGSGVTRVTYSAGLDYDAEWSPDGKRIAFMSERGGVHNIYTINPDGSATSYLTVPGTFFVAATPTWSPTSKQIAFRGMLPGGGDPGHLYVANADGSAVMPRTPEFVAFDPAWGR